MPAEFKKKEVVEMKKSPAHEVFLFIPQKPAHQREAAVYEAVPCCRSSYWNLTIVFHRAEVNTGGLLVGWRLDSLKKKKRRKLCMD